MHFVEMKNMLPKGWVWTRVGNVISNISLTGKKIKKSEYQLSGKYPVIDQGQTFIGGFTDKEEFKITTDTPLIIFGDHTKVYKYVDFPFVAGADGVKVIKPDQIFYPKLFYYFAQAVPLPEKGYARHFQWLEKSFIPLPPLPEQHRIVAKIEELFTRLDAGVEALKKIKAQLKCYRQAVLKYAFEGKLTKEWREANKDKLEPASLLLEKIKEQRKKEAKGKFKELPPIDTSDLPELPEGWVWTRLGDIVSFEYGKSLREDKRDTSGNVPVYGSNGLVGYHSKPLTKGPCIIIGRKGAAGEVHLSKVSCWPIDTTYYVYPPTGINLVFLGYLLSSLHLTLLDKSTAIPGLNRNDAYSLNVVIPPTPEQHKIVEEIECRLSIADNIEKVVEQSLKQAERLRQSILKRAFEGKLVPQDPTDEPAEILLERIRSERAKQSNLHKIKHVRRRKV